MLEQRDLEMIAEVVRQEVERTVPKAVREEVERVVPKAVQQAVDPLKKELRAMQVTLETETNKGIQIIAEGHLDLSRKLSEALKINNEKEMMLLRINRLESELEKIKVMLQEKTA